MCPPTWIFFASGHHKNKLLSVECILSGLYTGIVFPELGGAGGGTYFGGVGKHASNP